MNKWVAVVVLDLMVLTAAVGLKAMTSSKIIVGPAPWVKAPSTKIIVGPAPW